MEIVRITSRDGKLLEPRILARAERVHRQLRPQIPGDYSATMTAVCSAGGELCAAVEDGTVLGVALFRVIDNTAVGRKLYVDDLVTDDARRSEGIGHAMLEFLTAEARARGCNTLDLDSGTQRQQAHKFYFREGLVISAFSFSKPLEP
jgi:GNAT superfamily N-acetyltransferase